MTKKELINDLTKGNVTKKLLTFAFPFMLSTLMQTAYSTADMVIVGRYVGSSGLSAVSTSSQFLWLTTSLCMGFTNGGQIIISQLLGAGRREDLQKTIGTIASTVVIVALFVTVFGLVFTKPILRLLSTPREAFGEAVIYLSIVFTGTVFTYGYNLVSSILRGMGDSKHPFIFVTIAAAANVVLDIILVAVLDWGVAGTAIATVFSQALSLFISIRFLYQNREVFGFDFKPRSFLIDWDYLGKLLRLAIPFAMQNSAICISMLFVNKFINQYGLTASATFGTGTRIEQLPWVVVAGIMMATATMVAQNMGAGQIDRIKKTVNIAAAISAVCAVVFMALYYFFPREIYSIFTSDPDVLDMAPMFMLALVVSLPATTMMCPYQAFIEGIGNAKLVMIIALLDGFVSRIIISLLLANVFNMGLMGWFLGYGLAAYVNTIISVIYYYSGIWKKRSAIVQAKEPQAAAF
ncbi:MAG: MATE family efflux transporter [Bacillota bacterium]|jgi:putative MATE family efflux protein|nr:MATE family efflux transporter [Bacillota bacterium]HHU30551.1 MATE family efflux transporter [Bacillota bacterium]